MYVSNAFVSQIHIYSYFWSVLHSRFFQVPGCSLDSNCFLLQEVVCIVVKLLEQIVFQKEHRNKASYILGN